MALIELRDATIRLLDGSSATSAINDTPVNGNTDLDIDTNSPTPLLIKPGRRFTVVGSSREFYHVTSAISDELQLVTVDAASGNFTLSFTGTVANPIATQTTGNIAEGATGAVVQTALEGLAAIAVGDVTVTGAADGPWTVQFKGQYANLDMNLMTINDVDLVTIVTTTVAQTNQGGNTTNITFTPALATADGIPIDDAVITVLGNSLEIKIGEGNLSYTESRDLEYVLDRGNLDTVKENDQVPVDVTFDFIWDNLTAIGTALIPTIEDALKNRGPASTWVSSSSDPCEPYALDIEVEHVPPCGGFQREFILLSDFRHDSLEHDLEGAAVSSTGRCNVTEATITRRTQ